MGPSVLVSFPLDPFMVVDVDSVVAVVSFVVVDVSLLVVAGTVLVDSVVFV